MDFGEIISNSLKYPTKGIGKVILLGIILIIPIVDFIGIGYLLRVMKATVTGFDELPDFDEVGELFIDGLKLWVISIIYTIPLIIAYVLIFAGVLAQSTTMLVIAGIYFILFFLLLLPFALIFAVRSVMLLASNE